MKFTTASDVWSFAITVMEIFQDGERPYPKLANQDVIKSVMVGLSSSFACDSPACAISAKLRTILSPTNSTGCHDRVLHARVAGNILVCICVSRYFL